MEEFFRNNQHLLFAKGNSLILKACLHFHFGTKLKYLMFPMLGAHGLEGLDELGVKLSSYKHLRGSVEFASSWGDYVDLAISESATITVEIVYMLAVVNEFFRSRKEDWGGSTVLHYCALNGWSTLCKLLLQSGTIDPNLYVKRSFGAGTALHIAIENHQGGDKYLQTVKVLLDDSRTDPNAGNHEYGVTPLHQTVIQSSSPYKEPGNTLALLQMLLKRNDINVNKRDMYGKTPLITAVRHMDVDCTRTLLAHPESNIRIRSNKGDSVLIAAIKSIRFVPPNSVRLKPYMELINMLLADERVDQNSMNTDGQTAIHITALSAEPVDSRRWFHRIDMELEYTIVRAHVASLNAILKCGRVVHVNHTDIICKTPLDYALGVVDSAKELQYLAAKEYDWGGSEAEESLKKDVELAQKTVACCESMVQPITSIWSKD